MGFKENNVWNLCRIKCGTFLAPLYRNNIGYCECKKTHYGLKVGSGDGISPAPITITPEMVGCTISVFMSIETKATGKASKEQLKWRDDINARGGIAVIAHSQDDIPDPQKWQFPRAK